MAPTKLPEIPDRVKNTGGRWTFLKINYLFQYYAVKIIFALLNFIPLVWSGWFLKRVGDLFYCVSSKRRNIALANLSIAYQNTISAGQKRTIVRRCFENGCLSILELFLIKKIKKDALRRFTLTGKSHFETAFSRGKGVIFVASHLGSWEYIGFAGFLNRVSQAVIVKKIKNTYLNDMIDILRREIETLPIPKVHAIRQTLTELRKNHGVAVVIDQWGGGDGIWADFFGVPTSTTSLPARLAKMTGCALIPIYCLRKESGQYQIEVLPEVNVSEGENWEFDTTNRLNRILETQILRYPEQWSWGHKRWKFKPLTTRLA